MNREGNSRLHLVVAPTLWIEEGLQFFRVMCYPHILGMCAKSHAISVSIQNSIPTNEHSPLRQDAS